DIAGIDVPVAETLLHLALKLSSVLELHAGDVDRKHRRRNPLGLPELELLAGRIENPLSQRQDGSGLLGNGDEGARHQQAPRLVIPPDQRLKTDNAPVGELDLRLIVELELALVQSEA